MNSILIFDHTHSEKHLVKRPQWLYLYKKLPRLIVCVETLPLNHEFGSTDRKSVEPIFSAGCSGQSIIVDAFASHAST